MSEFDPGQFQGRPEAYAAWAKANFVNSHMWCAKHWAPCPVEGKNGVQAMLLLTGPMMERIPVEVRQAGPMAMNSYMMNWMPPLCCYLGDERMAEVWAQCS